MGRIPLRPVLPIIAGLPFPVFRAAAVFEMGFTSHQSAQLFPLVGQFLGLWRLLRGMLYASLRVRIPELLTALLS